ncbi:MAG: response regulator [Candidatus Omnitrophica bacterium]|nr:response regulator [Candidatus Omnitrophota bacterium]MBU1996270.1 response regulator [Candidatus Omnitrophota bacterium]MBU4334526.1 response regulator [Candidatus Omnitrophota bacterium]
MKILIVEDSRHDGEVIKHVLNQEGYSDISIVATGEEAIPMVNQEEFDFILVDTKLPGMDGFDVCSEIKTIESFRGKVIVMTGLVETVDAAHARSVGADDYCAKTTDCSHLIEAIKNLSAKD